MSQSPQRPASGAAPPLEPLLPAGPPLTAAQLVEELGFWERAGEPPPRPRVLLNMVSSLDGRATLEGRSGQLSGPADRELFHALRAAVDAVLVGAGTVRTERYGRMIADASVRTRRAERGLPEEPLACIVSGRADLDADVPLLSRAEAQVVLLTCSQARLLDASAHLDYVRQPGEKLDLAAALQELTKRFGVQLVLCEGGPHLAGELLAAGLVDELFLSLSPQLAGGEPATGLGLRIVAGAELVPPAPAQLRGVLREGSTLFLRYDVSA